jgi:hypothetical protein
MNMEDRGMMTGWETEKFVEKPAPVPCCPSYIHLAQPAVWLNTGFHAKKPAWIMKL